MKKLIRRLLIFNIPFLLVSGIMFCDGFTSDEKALTNDGYNLQWFFYLMGDIIPRDFTIA